jgi:hypothetical protein
MLLKLTAPKRPAGWGGQALLAGGQDPAPTYRLREKSEMVLLCLEKEREIWAAGYDAAFVAAAPGWSVTCSSPQRHRP